MRSGIVRLWTGRLHPYVPLRCAAFITSMCLIASVCRMNNNINIIILVFYNNVCLRSFRQSEYVPIHNSTQLCWTYHTILSMSYVFFGILLVISFNSCNFVKHCVIVVLLCLRRWFTTEGIPFLGSPCVRQSVCMCVCMFVHVSMCE